MSKVGALLNCSNLMGRKNLIRTSNFPYHVVVRSNNREWFPLEMRKTWEIYSDLLTFVTWAYGIHVHAFVLMSNHFHLILSTPERNLDESMKYLLGQSSKEINRLSGRINRVYGGRYKWTIIDNESYLINVLRYVYENPLKAGLVSEIEYYPYSTLNGVLGQSRLSIPLYPIKCGQVGHSSLPNHPIKLLDQLKKRHSIEQDKCISTALRRSEFKIPRSKEKDLFCSSVIKR